MVAGVFSANAQSSTTVPEAQWKAGNYYYLKTGSSVLSLSGEKADSVIVKTLASDATKAAIDSALWQITNAGTTPAGPVYQFKNKKTQAVLSFSASSTAKPVITSGVNQWTFSDAAGGSAIQAYYGNNQILALDVAGTDLITKYLVTLDLQGHIFSVRNSACSGSRRILRYQVLTLEDISLIISSKRQLKDLETIP